ncbi:MAG: hypothetical protein LJF06_11170 [Gemmatimonadetes bacterium]|nr:hypothetical protein [Gemmatimonadota bacterium]
MSRLSVFVRELRQRRVVRAVLAYGAAVAVALQGTEMTCTALALPDLAYRITVIAAIAGFPLVAMLAWAYDLTAGGLRRAVDVTPEEERAPIPVGRYLQLVGAFTVSAVIVLATAGAVSHLRYPASDDGRVGLAIFPLRTSGAVGDQWSAGVPDLLATALDGTPSLRIVDPWSLWRPLRPQASAAPRPPDVEQAATLAEGAGAHRFLLGSVVGSGDRLDVAFRLYRVGRAEPMDAFVVPATSQGMSDVVRDAALRVLARVWGPLRRLEVPAELDFNATQSPEALKAYLAAEEALRRGMVDSANAAIDRSLALDSTFVLAMVRAAEIKSWVLWMRGQRYRGLWELLLRAQRYQSELDPRSRLRLEASWASVRTDGPAAIEATRGILEMDPLDYGANRGLEYYYRTYGWQLTPPVYGSRELAERVVRMDSTQLPALVAREWWAVSLGDTADERIQLGRLSRVDTTAVLARARIRGLRAVLAGPDAFQEMLPTLVPLPIPEFMDLGRHLGVWHPSRYRAFLEAVDGSPESPSYAQAWGFLQTLDITQGWSSRVDSAVNGEAHANDNRNDRAVIELYIIAADLAGVGDRVSAQRAVASLTRYLPTDSALAYYETRPVWWGAWLMGSWHAQVGDPAVARMWMDLIGTLPGGGTSRDYRGGLQSDIQARLAVRRGEPDAAVALARRAMELWTIHTENDYWGMPSPMMRLHLALLLRDAGQRAEAAGLLSSLVPATTWMGFLTGRADFELGRMAAEDGDRDAARLHLRRALALWADGGPDVSSWVARARAQLDSLEGG